MSCEFNNAEQKFTTPERGAGKPIYLLGAPWFGVFDPDTSLSDLEDQLPKQLYRYTTVCNVYMSMRSANMYQLQRGEYHIGQSRAIWVHGYVWN